MPKSVGREQMKKVAQLQYRLCFKESTTQKTEPRAVETHSQRARVSSIHEIDNMHTTEFQKRFTGDCHVPPISLHC